jgi:hypothetical protein
MYAPGHYIYICTTTHRMNVAMLLATIIGVCEAQCDIMFGDIIIYDIIIILIFKQH